MKSGEESYNCLSFNIKKNCSEKINGILKGPREEQSHAYLCFTYKIAQEEKTSAISTCHLQVIQTMPKGTWGGIAGYY